MSEMPLITPQASPFAESLEVKNPEVIESQFTSIDGVILDNPILYNEDQLQEIKVWDVLEASLPLDAVTWDSMEEVWQADDTSYIGQTHLWEIWVIAPEITDISPPIEIIESLSTQPILEKGEMTKIVEWEVEKEEITDLRVPEPQNVQKTQIQKKSRYEEKKEEVTVVKSHKKSHIKPEKREKLVEIINNVKTLIARGQIDDARAVIVSGLSIEKDNRELNLLMASLYERDHAFAKAEFILKDIATENPDDIEVLTHLATDLAMQRKYDVSYELYKKVLSLGGETEETLYTLTHLASEMSLPDDVVLYARSYLKQYPHNPEILWIYAQWLISLGQRKEAVETLIKLKNLTPYNQEIADLIQKLVTEEELAGNFGGEK